MKKVILFFFIFFATVGVLDAGYLSYEKLNPSGSYSCNATDLQSGIKFNCNQVLDGPYAQIWLIPLSFIGFIYYLLLFSFGAIQLVTEKQPYWLGSLLHRNKKQHYHWLKFVGLAELILLLTGMGFAFSLYLVFLMAFVIKAWCYYCLASALTSTILLALILIYWQQRYHHSPFLIKKIAFYIFGQAYQHIFKPLAFLVDAELVHNHTTELGKMLGSCRLTRSLVSLKLSFSHPRLKKKILGLQFNSPIGLSGGFDYNGQLTQIIPSVGFGWHTIGTVTLHPYQGNQPPRLGRMPRSKALLVNKGLKSLGAAAIIRHLEKMKLRLPTAISIASTNKHFNDEKEQILDIVTTFKLFEQSRVSHQLYELNISCPNTFGGEPFTTCLRLDQLLTALDKLKLNRPVLVKMPIDQSSRETLDLLKIIDQHQIAGVIFGNLTKDKNNPAVDAADRRRWKKMRGNLSGRPTFARSNRLIKLTRQHFGHRFVIVGTGGIMSGPDAWKKIQLGADLLQLISGMIYQGPQLIGEINLYLATRLSQSSNGEIQDV